MRGHLYTPRFWRACAVHFTGAMALAQFILFPLFIQHLGGDQWAIGAITGLGYAAAVAIRLLTARWLDRVGRRTVLVGAGLLHSVSCLMYLTSHHIGTWVVAITLLHGMAGGLLFAAYFTYAADIVPPLRRAEGIAVFGLCGLVPNGIAPALGQQMIAFGGFTAYFVTAATWALVSLVLSLGLPERERSGDRVPAGHHGFLDLLRRPALRRPMFATLTFGLGVVAIFTFLAPFAVDSGFADVGGFFFCYALAAALVRLLGGRIPDLVGAERVVVPALSLLGLGLGGVALLDRYPSWMIFVAGACGAAHGYLFPVLNSLVVTRSPEGSWAAVVSLYTAMFDVGAMLGAPLLGAIARRYGYHLMYVTAGGIVGAGFVAMLVGERTAALRGAAVRHLPSEES